MRSERRNRLVDRELWIVNRRTANHVSRATRHETLLRDSSGQALALGAMTLFLLSCFVAFSLNVGQVSAKKLEIQHAADEGAYAGAVALADILSEIAWLNDAQAHLYYHAMRQAVDVVVYGTLAAMAEHGPPFPDDALVGVVDAPGKYIQAYDEAQAWFPRYADWVKRLGQIQWGLASVGPSLVRRDIFNAVYRTMGLDPDAANPDVQVALFPDFELLPDPDGYYRLDITRYQQDPAGWLLADSAGFWLRTLILGPADWSVQSSTGLDLLVSHPTPSRYVLTLIVAGVPNVMTFDFYPGLGWVLQMPGFTVQPGSHGGTVISGAGGSHEFRRGPDGELQERTGNGWQNVGGSDTVTVDGVEIPVVQDGIEIPPDTWVGFDPLRILFQNIQITPTGRNLQIEGQFGPAWVTVDQDYVVCNGLSTRNPEGVWRRYGDDRTRHRMSLGTAPDTYVYEWKKIGAYLQEEPSGQRFGWLRAIGDNNPSGLAPLWAYNASANLLGWFDPARGAALHSKAYHQTRPCWHPLDAACPVHGGGGGCPGNSTGLSPTDGGWHEINPLGVADWISCPVCARADAGDVLDDDLDRCSDVRKYGPRDIVPPGPPGAPRYESARVVGFPQTVLPHTELRIPRPLVLTEDFFKYGINVGVWKRADPAGLGEEFRLMPQVFPLPAGFTGRLAVASAKCGLRDTVAGTIRYRFANPDWCQAWVLNDPENLYVADWEARLWSVRDAIQDIDIDADLTRDSGLTYLFRGLLATEWHTADDDARPAWGLPGGMGLNLLDPDLKDVVRH